MNLIWDCNTRRVHGESCMFAGKETASLLFPAEKILRGLQPGSAREYLPGRDYSFVKGNSVICRTQGSALPFLTAGELSPAPEHAILYPEENNNAITGGPGGTLLRFDNRDFFSRVQIEVDYVAEEIDFPVVPDRQTERLPRFRRKLKEGKSLTIALVGDSISEGYNATGFVKVPPFTQPWIEQFSNSLAARFGTRNVLRNCGVNGGGSSSAFRNGERWLLPGTDLLIVAYGMNDFMSLAATQYIENIVHILEEMRKVSPETEFLLVTSMSGNPIWRGSAPGPDRVFAEALRDYVLCTDCSIALADVFSIWQETVRRKGFYSMTGNGVNHPNDFGHRLYASVLLDLF